MVEQKKVDYNSHAARISSSAYNSSAARISSSAYNQMLASIEQIQDPVFKNLKKSSMAMKVYKQVTDNQDTTLTNKDLYTSLAFAHALLSEVWSERAVNDKNRVIADTGTYLLSRLKFNAARIAKDQRGCIGARELIEEMIKRGKRVIYFQDTPIDLVFYLKYMEVDCAKLEKDTKAPNIDLYNLLTPNSTQSFKTY